MSTSTRLDSEPRPSEQIQRKVIPWKVTADLKLHKAENPWESSVRTGVHSCAKPENDPEQVKTQVVFKLFRGILNRVTPEKLDILVNQVTELDIDTKERLSGVVELTFEKAISEPSFSRVYAKMCQSLKMLTVHTPDGLKVTFNKLLLLRCQKEFEKDKDDNEILKKKQEELEAASGDQEKKQLTEELEEIKYKAKRESVSNLKFLGELYKLKMLTDGIACDCIAKLLKDNDEVSLECLCTLVSAIGKQLELGIRKTCLDKCFDQMKQIVTVKSTSNRICFMLQDVLELRLNKWVPRHKDQGPKTIGEIRKEANLEGQRFNQQPHRRDNRWFNQQPDRRDNQRFNQQPDRRDNQRFNQQPDRRDNQRFNQQPDRRDNQRFNQQPDRRDNQRFNQQPDRRDNREFNQQSDGRDNRQLNQQSDRQRGQQFNQQPDRQVGRWYQHHSTFNSTKPSLTEEQLEKKSSAIIKEYLNINDMKEALQCVQELKSTQLLFLFVRKGLEYTLDRNATTRECMGLLLHQLIKSGILPPEQYCKGLQGIIEETEDLAIDIPKIWLYLSELLTPMLLEGGIPMGVLFREISKPLIPLGTAGVLLVHILNGLCKAMSREKAGIMWKEAGLRWKDFLPEDEDVHKFVTEKNVEFTLDKETKESQKKKLSSAEQKKELDTLIQDKADNHTIADWIENNLDEQQTSSNTFIRTLTTCICQSTIISDENYYIVDHDLMRQRATLLKKYLHDEEKQLQALSALQVLMVQMDHPSQLLRMFFDCLYDFDVITIRTYYKWELNKNPGEQQGKDVALQSVTNFFAWLHDLKAANR
ncbi:eukaryotic translation initiation factor 4 gamma 1-like [Paralichthys olivaceus]|uniref:eukaryotic translation initiation factor 4 gamma 1-like n=1 Tax=Paralichthys olivaceus TaxID=8255 RepID=UPI0037517760